MKTLLFLDQNKKLITMFAWFFLTCATVVQPLAALKVNMGDSTDSVENVDGQDIPETGELSEAQRREQCAKLFNLLAPEQAAELDFENMPSAELARYERLVEILLMQILGGEQEPGQHEHTQRNNADRTMDSGEQEDLKHQQRSKYAQIYAQWDPENAAKVDFQKLSDEEFAQYKTAIDQIMMQEGQATEPKRKFPTSKFVAAYALWRKWFDVFKHDRTTENKGRVPDWLKYIDKGAVKPIGAGFAVWEKLQDANLDSPDQLMMALQANPRLPYEIQKIFRRAMDDSSYYESRFALWKQLPIKFAPALLYHFVWNKWYNKEKFDERGGYYQVESHSASSGVGANLDVEASDDVKRGGYSISSQVGVKEYEQGLHWDVPEWVPGIGGYRRKTAQKAWDRDREWLYENKDGYTIRLGKGDQPYHRSKALVDSSLYQTTVSSAVDLLANKWYSAINKQLTNRVGEEKLTAIEDKTYGIVSTNIIWYLCRGLANCALHKFSNSQYNTGRLAGVLPKYEKYDLNIVDSEKIKLVKVKDGWTYKDSVRITKDISYAKYLAKQAGRAMMFNFASYVVQPLVVKAIQKRKGVASWIANKAQSFGNIFVRLGLFKQNPFNKANNAVKANVTKMLCNSPQTLGFMLMMCQQQDQAQAAQEQSFEAMVRSMENGSMYKEVQNKIARIVQLKEYQRMYQTDYLALRSDTRVTRCDDEIKELTEDIERAIEQHGLLSKLGDAGFMMSVGYVLPWIMNYAEEKMVDAGVWAGKKAWNYATADD